MIAREGTWAEVVADSYVQSPDGTAWRVERVDANSADLLSAAGVMTPVVFATTSRVTILEPTEAEAIELVGRRLGGTVINQEEA